MTTYQSPAQSTHDAWCRLTRIPLPFSMTLNWLYEAWLAHGYTEADLSTVVKHRQAGIRKGERREASLLPRNLIRDVDAFAEDLSMARASLRGPKINAGRAATLRATGRPDVGPSRDCAPAATILEQTKLARDLKAWRQKELQ